MRTKSVVCAAAAALSLLAPPARAQLGTSPNIPPQQLFETDHPPRLETGLGVMAERDPKPLPARRPRRPVRH